MMWKSQLVEKTMEEATCIAGKENNAEGVQKDCSLVVMEIK